MLPLQGVVWLLFLATTAWAVVHFIRKRNAWRVSSVPILVCAITLVVVLCVPFTQLWLKYKFLSQQGARDQVVQQILRGTLQPNVAHNRSLVSMGPNAPYVSLGGNEVIVEHHDGRTYVFFFTFRGILDNYAGFLYVPDGGDPAAFSDLSETLSTEVVKMADNWFYASHR